ncbi:MAG: S24 family peptidase [Christensenellales bacterium]|jgi:phage repressor protein C with HTH and peptisase S24 domain
MVRVVFNEELLRLQEAENPVSESVSMIVYNFPAAAGIPLYAEDDSYERLEFPASSVSAGADFGIRISGDSMEPTIPIRDFQRFAISGRVLGYK